MIAPKIIRKKIVPLSKVEKWSWILNSKCKKWLSRCKGWTLNKTLLTPQFSHRIEYSAQFQLWIFVATKSFRHIHSASMRDRHKMPPNKSMCRQRRPQLRWIWQHTRAFPSIKRFDSWNIHRPNSHHMVGCSMIKRRMRKSFSINRFSYRAKTRDNFPYLTLNIRYHVSGSLRPGIISKMTV